MRIYDIIAGKRDGRALTDEEIRFFIQGYTEGKIPDYQAAALLMAICIRGMDGRETAALTRAMADSGEHADLSGVPGIKVDKHSTGGVGDKTTLICGPIAAACGVKVAKMSGRGLGHTGGTVDKLHAIPGFQTDLDRGTFCKVLEEVGISVIGQSGNLAPADKRLYALRDVTGTVESIPLIASSVMSKKIACGSDRILLDVKTGSGAFMKTYQDALELARLMVSVGRQAGKPTAALITDMEVPLGCSIGNSMEVIEAVETLRGTGPADLTRLCLLLAAHMIRLAGLGDLEECKVMAEDAMLSGRAFICLKEMAAAQGGDPSVLDDVSKFPQAEACSVVRACQEGYLTEMDARKIGVAAAELGAGRERKEDAIDPAAGIRLLKKRGDYVHEGEPLARLYAADMERIQAASRRLEGCIRLGDAPPEPRRLVYAYVSEEGELFEDEDLV